MGASSWQYFVPYDLDLKAVLEALRRREFEQQKYYFLPGDEGWPSTMAQLFADENVQEEGTHSILDIFRIISPEDEDGYGTLRPLRPEEVVRHFGSATPDRAAFDRAHDNTARGGLLLSGRRWSGYCTPLYNDGVPVQIVIWGYSGD